jgi:voltage-gated potassium channel
MGAQRVATSILRPSVVDFLEISAAGSGETIDLEEVRLDAGSALVGTAIEEIERGNPRLRVVAHKRENEEIRLIPEPATRLEAGDLLVVIGDRSGLGELERQRTAKPSQN